MYAGVVGPSSSPGNSSPQLIRFLAKANRSQYVYVAGNSSTTDPMKQWWTNDSRRRRGRPPRIIWQTKQAPPPGSKTMVSLPNGTIEIKAGWRPLNPPRVASGPFPHADSAVL